MAVGEDIENRTELLREVDRREKIGLIRAGDKRPPTSDHGRDKIRGSDRTLNGGTFRSLGPGSLSSCVLMCTVL